MGRVRCAVVVHFGVTTAVISTVAVVAVRRTVRSRGGRGGVFLHRQMALFGTQPPWDWEAAEHGHRRCDGVDGGGVGGVGM